jgi:hypothetical protein
LIKLEKNPQKKKLTRSGNKDSALNKNKLGKKKRSVTSLVVFFFGCGQFMCCGNLYQQRTVVEVGTDKKIKSHTATKEKNVSN